MSEVKIAETLEKALNNNGRRCGGCVHKSVCVLYKTVLNLYPSLFPNQEIRPFDAEDLAQLCSCYVDGSLLKHLETRE
jgi:hypothetical protein